MSKLDQREFIEETMESQRENTTHYELLNTLENKDSTLEAFLSDTDHIAKWLKIPTPGFVSGMKKYIKEKKKDYKNELELNQFVKRADILNFQETLDNWSVEDEELADEMMALSEFCTTVLELVGEDIIDKKKEKQSQKQKYREMKYWADEDEYNDLDMAS